MHNATYLLYIWDYSKKNLMQTVYLYAKIRLSVCDVHASRIESATAGLTACWGRSGCLVAPAIAIPIGQWSLHDAIACVSVSERATLCGSCTSKPSADYWHVHRSSGRLIWQDTSTKLVVSQPVLRKSDGRALWTYSVMHESESPMILIHPRTSSYVLLSCDCEYTFCCCYL